MLVLRRKIEEGILIDGRITVKILGIDGDSIKIGVEAPRDVPVFRSEVIELLEQNKAAQVKCYK
ncbi:MAG: carbon storage regulator CsrA [Firmicutes bacterium]|nr:carbon storage regulator CsrA [Bacillota bacterium]